MQKEALVVFKKRLEDSSALLEAMRSPQILQVLKSRGVEHVLCVNVTAWYLL